MFTTPIRHTRLNTMEEVMNFSFRTEFRSTAMTKWQNNGQIAFADENGNVYVTPFRPEIDSILEQAGYRMGSMFVPFSNSEPRPDEYQWLVKIAEEENWAATYEEAFKVAYEKGVKPVKEIGNYQIKIKEVIFYEDTETHTKYSALTMKYLLNDTQKNVGTYIRVDEKTIVICDEYGRTFLVKAKTVANDLVNDLIGAGYTRTVHPERYVRKYEPKVGTEE